MINFDMNLGTMPIIIMFIFSILSILYWWFMISLLIKVITKLYNYKKLKRQQDFFKKNVISEKKEYHDISKKDLEVFNIDDINLLKDKLFKIFIAFENAYNNLDYGIMKLYSSKFLFENYYTGVKLNSANGNKKIIEKIEKKDIKIFDVFTTSVKQSISTMIKISYINYTVDSKGHLISGNKCVPITERFEVVFTKYYDRKQTTECPNCGANVSGVKCEFCRTPIDNEEFKITSIKKILN